jgi:hypothetical protein
VTAESVLITYLNHLIFLVFDPQGVLNLTQLHKLIFFKQLQMITLDQISGKVNLNDKKSERIDSYSMHLV